MEHDNLGETRKKGLKGVNWEGYHGNHGVKGWSTWRLIKQIYREEGETEVLMENLVMYVLLEIQAAMVTMVTMVNTGILVLILPLEQLEQQ